MTRKNKLLGSAAALVLSVGALAVVLGTDSGGEEAAASRGPVVRVVKSPACGCCGEWVEHLREEGFRVEVDEETNTAEAKAAAGVPGDLASCHTAAVGGYVVEGHVPAADIRRLLRDRPQVRGLAVPGMPVGSPGMEGPDPEPYRVIAFDGEGNRRVFAQH